MFDYEARLDELLSYRFCCSQALISLALELKGCENPEVTRELIRAMNGLCGGMGGSGKDCGALTGGACVIGLFCGRGDASESPHDKLNKMVSELVKWFEDEYGAVECAGIIGGDARKKDELCPSIMQRVFEKAVQIMLENDVEIN